MYTKYEVQPFKFNMKMERYYEEVVREVKASRTQAGGGEGTSLRGGRIEQRVWKTTGHGKEAEMAGTVHDAGKLTDKFQDVLEGNASRVDHARVSAAFCGGCLSKRVNTQGKKRKSA